METYKELLKLYVGLLYLIFYPIFILFLVIYFKMGILGWLFIALCLTPPTIIWYKTLKKRIRNYLNAIMQNQPKEWNIDRTIEEYRSMLEKKKRKSGK
jgi:hypothetical protein